MNADLQRRFGIPGVVSIEEGRGSLSRIAVTSDLASAEIYPHGAHLTSFQPRGARPLLFMSAQSRFEAGQPIRGGVPVIFPWFGPRAGSPAHGFARVRAWELASCAQRADGAVAVALALGADDAALRLTFTIGRALGIDLDVEAGNAPLTFEEALHTYLLVGDARQVVVEGLEGTDYIDKVDAFQRKTQPREAIRISGETDRVYLNARGACVVRDPVLGRTLTVEKEGSGSTVVWNPWIAKARAMPDFGDDEWPRMLCIETANVGESAIRLEPGRTHRMRALIRTSEA